MFCEFIKFDTVSADSMSYLSDILYNLILQKKIYDDGSTGRPNISLFFYPLYLTVKYSNNDSKEKLMTVLNEKYFGNQSGYEYISLRYNQTCSQSGSSQLAAYRSQNVKLSCPVCKSTNIKKITTIGRLTSIATVGLASSKIGKQYE